MKKFHSILVFFVVFSIIQVSGFSNPFTQAVKFCTLSDIHYYDTTLGTTGADFEKMIAREGKMFAESGAILESALQGIQNETPAFLLISGDLSKDGEKVGHQHIASVFSGFESSTGIKIFVVPGNHDIMNGHAKDFSGDSAIAAPSITPQEFSQIYGEFGFNEAISRDDSSLSYIAEPSPGIWLFALDDCEYKENTPEDPVVAGKFSDSTLSWIQSKLQEARRLNKTVIGMMHHGLLEHFTGQKLAFGEFVVDDYQSVSEMFAVNGMKMVFTGHFHASDITQKSFPDGSFITDIETGSPVNYPSTFRTVILNTDLTANINTTRIQEINYDTGDKDFQTYAEDLLIKFFRQTIAYLGQLPVESGGYGLSESDAVELAAIEAEAFKAHYAGDELPDEMMLESINAYLNSDIPAKVKAGNLIGTLWTDLAPSDNSVILDLQSEYTGIDYEKAVLPSGFNLEQNYPNPFNPSTTIIYTITKSLLPGGVRGGLTTLKVFNLLGQEIATLVNEKQSPGTYKVTFDASNLASGVYLYQLKTEGGFSLTKKLLLLK
jgi:3',5'-cyclic AMP phosphodiesterase CpdA